MLIKGLNEDVMKSIFTYLPKRPNDGTDDDRLFKKWLKTDEGKFWMNQDGCYKSVHNNEIKTRVKRGVDKNEFKQVMVLKWFIDENGDLDNKYVIKRKCCIDCGLKLPYTTPEWKNKCLDCWKGKNRHVCLFD